MSDQTHTMLHRTKHFISIAAAAVTLAAGTAVPIASAEMRDAGPTADQATCHQWQRWWGEYVVDAHNAAWNGNQRLTEQYLRNARFIYDMARNANCDWAARGRAVGGVGGIGGIGDAPPVGGVGGVGGIRDAPPVGGRYVP